MIRLVDTIFIVFQARFDALNRFVDSPEVDLQLLPDFTLRISGRSHPHNLLFASRAATVEDLREKRWFVIGCPIKVRRQSINESRRDLKSVFASEFFTAPWDSQCVSQIVYGVRDRAFYSF